MRMIKSHHVVAVHVHVHSNSNYYCHKMYPPWPSLICTLLLAILFSIEFGMHQAMASPLTSCTFNDNNQNDDHPIEEILPPSSSFLFKSAASSSSLPSSSADPFALSKCACESDWSDAFCTRLDHYARMEPEKAPSVCICRQMAGPRQCRQFLSRCFHRPPPPPLSVPVLPFSPNAEIGHQLPRHRPNPLADQCACCFNQPDQFCNQLECQQMRPIFDPVANTTCRCFFPKGDWQQKMGRKTATTSMEEYPPEQICANSNQHWPRRVEINDNEEEAAGNKIDEADNTGKYSSSWSPQTSLANLLNSKAPYARLVSLLLLALLASLLLAVLVCFWSHWRRIRRGRRKAKVEADDGGEQPATEECVVIVTSTSQLNLDEDGDDSSHSPPQQQPQWNGTTMDWHNQQQQQELEKNNNDNNNIVEKAAAANEKRRKTKKSTKLRDENGALLQEATV